jgi:hypothetical protein
MVIGAAIAGAAMKANATVNMIAQDLIWKDRIERFIVRDPPARRPELHAPVSSAHPPATSNAQDFSSPSWNRALIPDEN